MNRRLFVLGGLSLLITKNFVRKNETIYLSKTLRQSDYGEFSIMNCKIKPLPWFSGESLIHLNSLDDLRFVQGNHLYPI